MGSEMESDMLSPAADRGYAGLAVVKQLEAKHEDQNIEEEEEEEAEDLEEANEVEDGCDDGCCDEEDPLAEAKDQDSGDEEEPEEEEQEPEEAAEEDAEEAAPAAAKKKTKKKRAKSVGSSKVKKESSGASKRSKSIGATSRLEELSKPKAVPDAPPEEPAPIKQPEKKKGCKPSLLLKLRPSNLQEQMEAFFEGGCTEAPKFTYSYSDEVVSKAFQDNSTVCFDYLPDAKRIMDKVLQSPGGPDAFMQLMYGEEKVSSDELRDLIADYLKDHNVEDLVEIRIVEGMLSAANVVSGDGKMVVNIAKGPVSKTLIQSICDHEVGTHLLRMMNDEHQVWHGIRNRYRLANPWTTEEGFATLNTYQTLPSKLMFPQALRYWAVCRGAQTGFVELFHELQAYVSDTKRCWQICCRIKRGMLDTSQPGAFYMDQAYFKGAVEILKHLDEVDFGKLYAGQIALQDLDKVHFLLRKEVVRLPRFLNSAETLKKYLAHCRVLIKENMIETASERVCKRVFVRAGMEFFKKEEKKSALKSVTLGAPSKTLDLSRLEDLAKPRNFSAVATTDDEGGDKGGAKEKERDMSLSRTNFARLAELALPRKTDEDFARTTASATDDEGAGRRRPSNLERLAELATPRKDKPLGTQEDRIPSRTLDPLRLLELARPKADDSSSASRVRIRRGSSVPVGDRHEEEVPPPPEPWRPPDLARLASLAAPKKVACEAETLKEPCNCKPKKAKRKRRSKLRLLAMVQQQKESQTEQPNAEEDQASDGEAEGSQEEAEENEQLRQILEAEQMMRIPAGDGRVELQPEDQEILEGANAEEMIHEDEASVIEGAEDQEIPQDASGRAIENDESWQDFEQADMGQEEEQGEAEEKQRETEREKERLEAKEREDLKRKELHEKELKELREIQEVKEIRQDSPETNLDQDELDKHLDKHEKLEKFKKLELWQRPGYGGYGPSPTAKASLGLPPRHSLVEVAVQGSAARREKPRLSAGLVRAATRATANAPKAVPIKTIQLDLGI
mmetsp:Transcript_98152/g.174727  ORF Transcript_98152/g.174727 Transcript_98152/m.174727 type:complete len:1017 (+) Transcript_98152:180-3230(+)|eukprot:CAMPEP_0197643634 /NCGR_PEP_ID=MMETSP1338-20131121/16879_1 /TAXON_ID=43686 ORGANISM="Pelagodinium beii, Strain RCC1491" /NCGR_SAMPLE_ID=MMETSP1338 /ASSEMBLY_ACC=CAM_ASM_000754 /LENGTH=1016 /DNA_ID=CAMNT_0043216907 /DNA_START=174 /DNA_END=3224 /DNA_ORIENTATION=-